MYVNTFICLEENISGYGMNKKTPNGHVTIMTPGLIRCYVQNLDQKGKPFVLYLMSKGNNKAVRVGELNTPDKDKETRWRTNINNLFDSGLKGNEIDGAAIVIEGDSPGNTDAILTGFVNNKYLIVPLIEKALPKKMVIQKSKVEVEVQPKVPEIEMETKEEPKIADTKMEVEVEPKVSDIQVEIEVEPKVSDIQVEVKVEPKVSDMQVDVKQVLQDIINQKDESSNEEDNINEKIEELLKATINAATQPQNLQTKITEEAVKEIDTHLDKMIKEQLEKIMSKETEKIEEVKETEETEETKDEEKIDFCEEREDCSISEKDYLNKLDKQLRQLQDRLINGKEQIASIRKGKLDQEIIEGNENPSNIFFEEKEQEELYKEEDHLKDYLDYTRVEEIFTTSEAIYPFETKDEDRDWVRISLSELISIPQLSYEWCTSPAITFSAHKFAHLILGKDKVLNQYYVGIPDIYHPSRITMLTTDKVERFLCCKGIKPVTGEYGYWIVNL